MRKAGHRSIWTMLVLAMGAIFGGMGEAPAEAANYDPLTLGVPNTATSTTYLEVTNGQLPLSVTSTGGQAPAITGTGDTAGISGFGGTGTGVTGSGGYGVQGIGTVAGVDGLGEGFDGPSSIGVFGHNATTGVYGWGPIGVEAQGEGADSTGLRASPGSTENGYAIDALGKVKLKESGKIVVQAGNDRVTKFDVRLLAGSIVLVTSQQNRDGVFVQAAVPNVTGDRFTVFLNKPVTRNTTFAWVVIN
jgi:hypothetical protein